MILSTRTVLDETGILLNDTETIVRRAATWFAAVVLAPVSGEVAGDLEKLAAIAVLSRTAPTR